MSFFQPKNLSPVGVARSALVAAALLIATNSYALTWTIQYDDVINNTGVGFDDPANGTSRQATMDAVTGYLSAVLTGMTGTIDLQVKNSQTDGTGAVGTGGTYFFNNSPGFSNGFAFRHASTGVDPASSVVDTFTTFDFGYNYYSGQGAQGSNQIDLYSVALHEIMHGLGFLNLLRPDGTSSITGADPGVYSVLNSRLVRGDGTPLFAPNGDFIGTPGDLTSGDLYFDGEAAKQANGGNLVKIHAPDTFQPGASLAHLDSTLFPNSVMNTTLGLGQQRRTLTDVEIGILNDIGYVAVAAAASGGAPPANSNDSTAVAFAVPGPNAFWLLLVGLVIVLRRRQ